MKHKLAVGLRNVTKRYVLHKQKPTFLEYALHRFRDNEFTALNGLNLKIYQGEKVGIVGKNGSGKTTLLKIIAGITVPSSGEITSYGKIVSLIDLGAGFHPDLSGEENIFSSGLLIGMEKDEIKSQFKNIVDFADIGRFITEPLYTYSEGMKLRLGFAVAVHADPAILILDEGISAGDKDFQMKTTAKINEFFKDNKTIIVVTHVLDFLEKSTNRIIWMEDGMIKKDGGVDVLLEYALS